MGLFGKEDSVLNTTLEVLQVAIELENKGMEFYREAAGRVQDKVVKAVLLSLADDEQAHQSIIRRYYHAIEAGHSVPPASGDILPPSKSASERIEAMLTEVLSPIGQDATYKSIYQAAVQFETMSYEFYDSQKSDNPRVSAFFKYLAGVEKIHREMLQLMVEPG